MNPIEEFEHWVARYNDGEPVFQHIVERGAHEYAMFRVKETDFLLAILDRLGPDHKRYNINLTTIRNWKNGTKTPVPVVQKEVIEVIRRFSEKWLRDRHNEIAGKFAAAHAILTSITNDKLISRMWALPCMEDRNILDGDNLARKLKSIESELFLMHLRMSR